MNADGGLSEKSELRLKPEPAVTPVLVQCAGFRCMAYQDTNGKWRSYYSHEALPGSIQVIPEF